MRHILRSLSLVLILGSCGGEPSIVGQWEGTGDDAGKDIEFAGDGTLQAQDCEVGSYRYVDDSRIHIRFEDGSLLADFTVSGDVLTLTIEDDSLVLVRAGDEAKQAFARCHEIEDYDARVRVLLEDLRRGIQAHFEQYGTYEGYEVSESPDPEVKILDASIFESASFSVFAMHENSPNTLLLDETGITLP